MDPVTFNPQVIVGEQVAGRAAKVRRQLLDLSADVKASTFDMIELLYEAKANDYPLQWGFASVLDYGIKELSLKERKVQYLTRIGTVCKAVGLTRAQYEPAGTSKLREITTLNPEKTYYNALDHVHEDLAEHIVRLILDSDKMNVEQVKEEVARLKGQVGKDRRVIRSYSTDVTTWTLVISAAIEKARKYLGSKGRDEETGNAVEYSEGACYECICAAFNADLNYEEDPGDNPKLPTEEKDMQDYINAELPMEEF
jgi:hypothetical protein